MRRDRGAIEPGAMAVLLFIAALSAGSFHLFSANARYIQRNKNDFAERQAAGVLLEEIAGAMQELKDYEYDWPDSPALGFLLRSYAPFSLSVEDISSGYHVDFLSDEDVSDPGIRSFLFKDGNGAAFISFRDSRGLSDSLDPWKPYLKDEILSHCVSHGWIHLSHTGSFAYRSLSDSFETDKSGELFPAVNDFPLMNVNMVDPSILRPLIMRPSFKIEKAAEKAEALIKRLEAGPLMDSDISGILNIPPGHALFDYLGTKTAFWRVRFHTGKKYRAEAVFAAIPERDGDRQEIAEYALIDRSIVYGP
ncbi:hypothetical protein LJC14_00510 [Treponema sp. OttesenSCG-928-L16]|nr:hypothetical protein [Treponema sp. OttesenSCG-928-L16]